MQRITCFLSREGCLDEVRAVKPIIVNVVAALCGQEWSSIAFHLRSPKFDNTAPRQPTILVSFFQGAALDFDKLESHLFEMLRRCKSPIKLELLRGSIDSTPLPSSSGKVLSGLFRKPKNGSSIGTAGNCKAAGSLGGWLHVVSPKDYLLKSESHVTMLWLQKLTIVQRRANILLRWIG